MNSLKVKANINCDTCGCQMKRTKTIQVSAIEKQEAIKEADEKIKKWQKSLTGQNCKICASIIKGV